MDTEFTTSVERIVELIVAGRYDQISKITGDQRLDAVSIERAVREYGKRLVMPPAEALDQLDVVPVRNVVPPRWSVRINLWTLEEGRSDLTLELTLFEGEGRYVIEVDDIHVL